MEALLEPYVVYPIAVIGAVLYGVLASPDEALSHWWKPLALGSVLILALAAIAGVVGYGASELLTFRARGTGAAALRIWTALGYISFLVGCGLLMRSMRSGSRGSRGRENP